MNITDMCPKMNHQVNTSHSEEIKDFVSALAKAQGQMKAAAFNRTNPHFKNRYADFTSCMDTCRQPLSENGLAVMQYCETVEGKLYLITMIAHSSGQWFKSQFPLITAKVDSQGIGSAMTYAKRYSLCSMLGIVADEDADSDDDAEFAVGRGKQAAYPKKEKLPPSVPVKKEEPVVESILTDDELGYLEQLLQGNAEERKKLEKLLPDFKKMPRSFYDKCITNLEKINAEKQKLEEQYMPEHDEVEDDI